MSNQEIYEIENSFKSLKLDENDNRRQVHGSDLIKMLQNENYHLNLELLENKSELLRLKKQLNESLNSKCDREALEETENLYSYDYLEEEEVDKFSINESELVSHFSGSPYKGRRANSMKTESSLATTTLVEINKDHSLFKNNILPFLENLILIFNTNFIFERECQDLIKIYDEFKRNNGQNGQLLNNILTKISFLTRQLLAILNRELRYSRRNKMNRNKTKEKFKQEKIKENEQSTSEEFQNYDHYGNFENEIDMKQIQNRIILKLDELVNNSNKTKHKEKNTTKSISKEEKKRLKENQRNLEIIPIGYNEQILTMKTPKRNQMKKYHYSITPNNNSNENEKDSLEHFLIEQAQQDYTLD